MPCEKLRKKNIHNRNSIVMVRQCNTHSLNYIDTAQRAQERDKEINICSELYTSFVLYMLVLQSEYSKFLFTIRTVQSWVRQHGDYQPVMGAAAGRLILLKFFSSFFLNALLTGLVRRRTVDQWRKNTASTKTSKRSSVYLRPCSVNKRTHQTPAELTPTGTFYELKRTLSFLKNQVLWPVGLVYPSHTNYFDVLYIKRTDGIWWQSELKSFFKSPKHISCHSWCILL